MRRTTFSLSIFALAIVLTGFAGSSVPASDKPKAEEELVAKHLDALGTPEARAALKSLNVQGNLMTKFLRGGTGAAVGPFAMVSTGHKSSWKRNSAPRTTLANRMPSMAKRKPSGSSLRVSARNSRIF
jgi:hypothetical protein